MDRHTEKSWITGKVETTREANRLQNTMHLIMFDWARLWIYGCVWGLYQLKVFSCWDTEITAVCRTINGCPFFWNEWTSVRQLLFFLPSLFPSVLGVWPSEEVMAHYCLHNRHKFKWVFLSRTNQKVSLKEVQCFRSNNCKGFFSSKHWHQ